MSAMILRNLKLYFRDRGAVFFSMLAVLIVIALYALFIADNVMSGSLGELENGKQILDLWIIGGLFSIVSITTTLASYGIMVNDRSTGIIKDFYASSIARWKLVLSYILAACITGMIMCIFTLCASQVYILFDGGQLMNWQSIISLAGLSLVSIACGSSMMFLLSLFMKSSSAFANASMVVGTLSGFIMGIYIPIGTLPSFAQQLIRFFPMSHACALFRTLLTNDILQDAMQHAPVQTLHKVKESLGITLSINAHVITMQESLLILIITTALFMIGSIILFKREVHG